MSFLELKLPDISPLQGVKILVPMNQHALAVNEIIHFVVMILTHAQHAFVDRLGEGTCYRQVMNLANVPKDDGRGKSSQCHFLHFL